MSSRRSRSPSRSPRRIPVISSEQASTIASIAELDRRVLQLERLLLPIIQAQLEQRLREAERLAWDAHTQLDPVRSAALAAMSGLRDVQTELRDLGRSVLGSHADDRMANS